MHSRYIRGSAVIVSVAGPDHEARGRLRHPASPVFSGSEWRGQVNGCPQGSSEGFPALCVNLHVQVGPSIPKHDSNVEINVESADR